MAEEQHKNEIQVINNSLPVPPLVRGRPATFPDVAMAIVKAIEHTGPLYAVFVLVGILVWKGHANALEGILGTALGLLAHSNPGWKDKLKLGGTGAVIVLVGYFAQGCL